MVYYASVILHEIGHTYLGDGHCEGKNCCFIAASEAFDCRVRGRLGLPRNVNEARSAGDYNLEAQYEAEPCEKCGDDTFPHACFQVEEGKEPGSTGVFYGWKCGSEALGSCE